MPHLGEGDNSSANIGKAVFYSVVVHNLLSHF
jgi:hypothetical protein